jgi:F-type H+-transporting ATPase subunit O
VRPPIQLFGVEGRYAHALYSAASKTDSLAKVEKEVATLKGLIATDGGLDEFLLSPILSRGDKTEALTKALGKKKFSATLVNFCAALGENNRLPETSAIISAFEQLMSAHRNELAVTITSAKPLDNKSMNAVKKSLGGFAAGKTLNVTDTVDEAIMGGLIIEIGDKYIDMSTATRIRKITQALEANI